MNKLVVFSQHSVEQLYKRKISKKTVVEVINDSDKITYQTNNRLKFLKKIKYYNKTYLLVVVAEKIGSYIKIITVFKTSKIKKYL